MDIYKGDFTVIMGSSGAGKSTLMYSLSGMARPTDGRITFCGEEITKLVTIGCELAASAKEWECL